MTRSEITKRIFILEGELKLLKKAVIKSLPPPRKKRLPKSAIERMAEEDFRRMIERNRNKQK